VFVAIYNLLIIYKYKKHREVLTFKLLDSFSCSANVNFLWF